MREWGGEGNRRGVQTRVPHIDCLRPQPHFALNTVLGAKVIVKLYSLLWGEIFVINIKIKHCADPGRCVITRAATKRPLRLAHRSHLIPAFYFLPPLNHLSPAHASLRCSFTAFSFSFSTPLSFFTSSPLLSNISYTPADYGFMDCPSVRLKHTTILNKHLLKRKKVNVCVWGYEKWKEKIEKERGGCSRPREYEQVQQGK